jgi:hypothetical protein
MLNKVIYTGKDLCIRFKELIYPFRCLIRELHQVCETIETTTILAHILIGISEDTKCGQLAIPMDIVCTIELKPIRELKLATDVSNTR